jgi:hypothetical protein
MSKPMLHHSDPGEVQRYAIAYLRYLAGQRATEPERGDPYFLTEAQAATARAQVHYLVREASPKVARADR